MEVITKSTKGYESKAVQRNSSTVHGLAPTAGIHTLGTVMVVEGQGLASVDDTSFLSISQLYVLSAHVLASSGYFSDCQGPTI